MSKGYYTLTRITDYGPYVVKLILPVGGTVKAKDVSAEKFSVYVERMDEMGNVLMLPKSWMALDNREPSRGYLPVRAAYPSDLKGNALKEGDCIALDMPYGPMYQLSSCISAPNGVNVYVKSRYEITQLAVIDCEGGALMGLTFDHPLGNYAPDSEGFLNAVSSYEPEPLNYGYFIPQVRNAGPRPLIIWLHGAGEGGYDPTIAYTGNKVVSRESFGR